MAAFDKYDLPVTCNNSPVSSNSRCGGKNGCNKREFAPPRRIAMSASRPRRLIADFWQIFNGKQIVVIRRRTAERLHDMTQ